MEDLMIEDKKIVFSRGIHVIFGPKGCGKSIFLLYVLNLLNLENKRIALSPRRYLEFLKTNNSVFKLDYESIDKIKIDILIDDDFNVSFMSFDWMSRSSRDIIKALQEFLVLSRHNNVACFFCLQDSVFSVIKNLMDSISYPIRILDRIFVSTIHRDPRVLVKTFVSVIPIMEFPTVV